MRENIGLKYESPVGVCNRTSGGKYGAMVGACGAETESIWTEG